MAIKKIQTYQRMKDRHERTRNRIRKKLENGEFENKIIEIEIADETTIGMQVLDLLEWKILE